MTVPRGGAETTAGHRFWQHPALARVLLGVAVLMLGWSYWRSHLPVGHDVAVAGGPCVVGGSDVIGVKQLPKLGEPGTDLPLETVAGEGGVAVTRVRIPQAGDVVLEISLKTGTTTHRRVAVASVAQLGLAALLLLVIAAFVPYALGSTQGGEAWYALLSERGGGYSLGRVQLLIWFLPAVILYGALSFTLHGFVAISAQLSLLLGLSGATTLLGAAATPPVGAGAPPVAPNLRDIVTGWDAHGDLSRYQYLLLSIVGAIVMIAAFWRQLEMPEVPAQFLYLLAGSQGTYVAAKAIKAAKAGEATVTADDGAGQPGAVATAAPATMVPAPGPPAGGSFVVK
jgi:hypothetical protein